MDIVFAGPRDGDARLAAALARGEPPTVLAAAGLARRSAAVELAAAARRSSARCRRLGLPGAVGLA
jgi:hypothetical protein